MNEIYAEITVDGKKTRKQIILEDRECIVCKKVFQPKRQCSVFCSKNCGKKNDYQKHKDKYIEANRRKYYENLEHYKQKRKEYYANNRDQSIEGARRWRDQNYGEYLEKNSSYHDKVRFGGLRKQVLDGSGRCSKCGAAEKLIVHHVDHRHDHQTIENLIILCRKCHINEHRLELVKAKNGS